MKLVDQDLRATVTVMFCGFAGIILAAIEFSLYSRGVLVDEYIAGTVTIADLMAITIILWLLFGVVIAVIRR